MTKKKQDKTHLRGFASMDKEKRKEIASKGGKNSPSNFKYNRERAVEAGKTGGRNSKKKV